MNHEFEPCDPGSIPAQCIYQIKIPHWSQSVSSLTLPNTTSFLWVLQFLPVYIYKHCQTNKVYCPYWTCTENSLDVTERVIQCK